jgi:hypothetical protein
VINMYLYGNKIEEHERVQGGSEGIDIHLQMPHPFGIDIEGR